MRKIDEIILHHSATKPTDNSYIDYLRIKNYHKSIGYKDIGYHFVIGADGAIFRGRDISQIGAHCKCHNQHTIGICLIGDFSDLNSKPTVHQIKSLELLVSILRTVLGDYPIYPHNLYRNTVCPGKFLTDYCKRLNSVNYVSPIH